MSTVFRDVTLRCRFVGGAGPREVARLETKRFFFALADEASLDELLPRLVYDANVKRWRASPDDRTWWSLEVHEVSPIAPRDVLAWNGALSREAAEPIMPWQFVAVGEWEYAVCYYVDAAGRYDGIAPNDFTELLAYAALAEGADAARVRDLFDRLFGREGAGEELLRSERTRRASIELIRSVAGEFRKPPGEPPLTSGPPADAHVAG